MSLGPWQQSNRCNLQYASPKDSLFPPILFILRREFPYLKLASARSDVSFSLESPEVHSIFILDLDLNGVSRILTVALYLFFDFFF
jgi:hypothetical protein